MRRETDAIPRESSEKVEQRPLLLSLREATAPLHERLDRGVMAALGTVERYATFLTASLAAVEPLESALAAFTEFPSAGRAARIRADLAALGATGNPVHVSVELPRTRAAAFGCAYVVEGSALGGVVLAGIVATKLCVPLRATTYLRLREEGTAAEWRRFVERLEDWGREVTLDARAEARVAAIRAFEVYAAAFSSMGIAAADDDVRAVAL
ncbi:MAG TPA: biliverdin-producing heme oxygenase [Polyangiaceae bacterium]|jgi:heme oxygenase|nr:biliverdin-producing heme oxygenase [Polyangiaceae bacterium]